MVNNKKADYNSCGFYTVLDKIIVHICNDNGKWGSGFVLAISKRWIKPKDEYMI